MRKLTIEFEVEEGLLNFKGSGDDFSNIEMLGLLEICKK